ncbi:leucine-rich repeat domain-containing protein [Oscillospiraceae bacterium 50-58]
MGDSAFYLCESLTSLTIPDSVTEIGEDAFSDCKSLTGIAIPKSVTKIAYSAFGMGVFNDRFHFCRNLTIQAPAGSLAELYAKKYGIPFRPL